MKLLFPLLPLLFGAAAAAPDQTPKYEIGLDDHQPDRVDFVLKVPAHDLTLLLPQSSHEPATAPECASTPLRQMAAGKWIKPVGCTAVHWSASLPDLDTAAFDPSGPVSGWSKQRQLWLLTGSLPWLRIGAQPSVPVRIDARMGRRRFAEISNMPADSSVPIAIVIGQPVRRQVADGLTIDLYGDTPSGPRFDRLQQLLVRTLAQWQRDLLLPGNHSLDHLNYVWIGPSPNAEPGIFASANSGAILIQYIPDPKSSDSDAKLAAGIFATGAHEAFHAFGAVRGAPAWANESLATYFAYSAARRHLTGASLRVISEMINAPSDAPLLAVEGQVEKGDQSEYGTFYSKGARFWAAIEKALTTKPNGSGKLAALIKQTNGLAGVNWFNAEAIAAYFNRYSNGRAGTIVRCYLLESGCPKANTPL